MCARKLTYLPQARAGSAAFLVAQNILGLFGCALHQGQIVVEKQQYCPPNPRFGAEQTLGGVHFRNTQHSGLP